MKYIIGYIDSNGAVFSKSLETENETHHQIWPTCHHGKWRYTLESRELKFDEEREIDIEHYDCVCRHVLKKYNVYV